MEVEVNVSETSLSCATGCMLATMRCRLSYVEEQRDQLLKERDDARADAQAFIEGSEEWEHRAITAEKENERLRSALKKIGVEASIAKENGCNLTRKYLCEMINEALK